MAANLLISGLPAAEQTRLAPFLQRVELADSEYLVRAGEPFDFVWFIESAVILTFQPMPRAPRFPQVSPAMKASLDSSSGSAAVLRPLPPSRRSEAALCA